ncbi:uncharacterized protein LACBIDRAFT_331666 [Laccaria bicolor S238N-H82]|uniref:Predicted protein n=1 Tax=Laccaria bicolor (strain S238N-H82 / ATCC MYA-4686) TaxID=486041 RepID=B0DQ64_LACBS|nr:uncharacterized protein LACBIDRAFT_331666 [Laccaria bicolor S238N-H82]EDR03239.1 predicted protein [Laccaria bicolor S238N-H82]|eukprot:XP_001886035.1 predicted protein [Laccaria bicolor S238N-H82]
MSAARGDEEEEEEEKVLLAKSKGKQHMVAAVNAEEEEEEEEEEDEGSGVEQLSGPSMMTPRLSHKVAAPSAESSRGPQYLAVVLRKEIKALEEELAMEKAHSSCIEEWRNYYKLKFLVVEAEDIQM